MTISEISSDYSIILTTPFKGRQITLLPVSVQDETPLPSNVEVVYSRKDFYNIAEVFLR